jgi:hypothetical protein
MGVCTTATALDLHRLAAGVEYQNQWRNLTFGGPWISVRRGPQRGGGGGFRAKREKFLGYAHKTPESMQLAAHIAGCLP